MTGETGKSIFAGEDEKGVELEFETVERRSHWPLALRALIFLALGALMMLHPLQCIDALIVLIGTFAALIDGCLTLSVVLRKRGTPGFRSVFVWAALSIIPVLAIIFALMFIAPSVMRNVLFIALGFWELFCGIEGLTNLKRDERFKSELFSSCLAVLAGLILILFPFLCAAALMMIAGAVFCATGFLLLLSLAHGSLLFRAVVFFVLGLLMLVAPFRSMEAITRVLGAFAVGDGLLIVFDSLRASRSSERWIAVSSGCFVVALGAFALLLPIQTDCALFVFLGVWQFVSGVETLLETRFAARKALNALSAVLTIAVGLFFMIAPLAGALALDSLFGILLIAAACLLFSVSFRSSGKSGAETVSKG